MAQIEHRTIPSLGFSGRFWPIRRPLFQDAHCLGDMEFSVVIVVSDAGPVHLQCRVTVDWPDNVPQKGARRR
jgi:hypothetical protein